MYMNLHVNDWIKTGETGLQTSLSHKEPVLSRACKDSKRTRQPLQKPACPLAEALKAWTLAPLRFSFQGSGKGNVWLGRLSACLAATWVCDSRDVHSGTVCTEPSHGALLSRRPPRLRTAQYHPSRNYSGANPASYLRPKNE
jgi:hypothetical protein